MHAILGIFQPLHLAVRRPISQLPAVPSLVLPRRSAVWKKAQTEIKLRVSKDVKKTTLCLSVTLIWADLLRIMHRKKRTATNSSENKQCLFLFFASLMWLKYIFLKFIEVHSSRFLQTDRSVPHTTPLLNILTLFPLTVCVFTFPGKLKDAKSTLVPVISQFW